MSTIVTRAGKGSPLTNTEMDSNLTNLNTDKFEIGGTYSGGTASTIPYLNGSKVLSSGTALQFDGVNLGLGVTPSAWASPFATGVFEFSGGFLAPSAANQTFRLGQNHYYNGSSYIYKANGPASAYLQNSGAHQWLNAASGTAGNAITFTQAMTLDASGNLGVGTTSPSGKFHTAFNYCTN